MHPRFLVHPQVGGPRDDTKSTHFHRRPDTCPRVAEEQPLALRDLVVITGFSGAGKSTAMAAFEDEGYFCVDNLPSEMIGSLVELFIHAGSKVAYAAVVSDVRAGSYFEGLAAVLDRLEALRRQSPRAVPGGQRGDAPDALQGDPPPSPAVARRQRRRWNRSGTRGARAAARARRCRDRHDRHDGRAAASQARRRDAADARLLAGWRSPSRASASSTGRRATPT